MRLIKTVCVVICTALLMTLLPGCGKANDSYRVKKLRLPDDEMFSEQISLQHANTCFILFSDGTYAKCTTAMQDNFTLLYWEMLLSEGYFNSIKKRVREIAATRTTSEYSEDTPRKTDEYLDRYEGISYEEYLEDGLDSIKSMGISNYFDKNTHRLINRPSERVEISFYYHPDDVGNPRLDKDKIIKYYKEGLKLAYNDPYISEYVLETVNAEYFKTGKELREIRINVYEEDDRIRITADTSAVSVYYFENLGAEKIIKL